MAFMAEKDIDSARTSQQDADPKAAKGNARQPLIVRMGGIRAVLAFAFNVTMSLALIAVFPIVALWPFGKTHHPTVEIHDEADVLQTEPLADELQRLTFRRKVHVAVLTVRGSDIVNLNDEVLKYARKHSDTDVPWISQSNSNYWSDGLVIFAVAPDGRKVGCYFGEDITIPLRQQAAVQNAAKDQYRIGDWYGGTVSMAKKTADLMGRPGSGDVGTTYAMPGVVAIAGLAWLCCYLYRGLAARRRAREALRHYSQVTHDYDTTELHASTIPEDEPHGAQVMARYRWFRGEYAKFTREWQDFGDPVGAQWFDLKMLGRVSDLKKRSAALDSLDDVIANTATLLTMSSGWEGVWVNEQGPVMEDLQSLNRLCEQVDDSQATVDTEETRAWVHSQRQRLNAMTSELEAGELKPSTALDELDGIADETETRARRLARRAIDSDTSRYADERRRRFNNSLSSSNNASYSGYWLFSGTHGYYDPHSTIRLNPDSPALSAVSSGDGGGSLSDDSGSFSSFTPISDLVVGYSSASSYVPSSSSGGGSSSGGDSSGGYSGGDFSGSGSSSSF